MLPPRPPVFLARETYRRRRLIDALRLLPVVGLCLFLAPLIGGDGFARSTALGGAYLYGAWVSLILVTQILVRLLARAPGGDDPDDPGP